MVTVRVDFNITFLCTYAMHDQNNLSNFLFKS